MWKYSRDIVAGTIRGLCHLFGVVCGFDNIGEIGVYILIVTDDRNEKFNRIISFGKCF